MAGLIAPCRFAQAQEPAPPAAQPPAATDPTQQPKGPNVLDQAMKEPKLSRFVDAVKAAGLTDTLKGDGPYTIFAPTNAAFAKLPAGTIEDLMKPENKSKFADLLKYHIVAGNLSSADILKMGDGATLKTLAGTTITLKLGTNPTAPKLNDAGLVKTDITASNGVIHVIDTVLTPPVVETNPPAAAPPANP
jgi:uncharacterized surface protein with fasciclin (FAS1) repeats